MKVTDETERAVHSWAEAMTNRATTAPRGYWRLGAAGTILTVTAAPLPELNSVVSISSRPDTAGIAEMASFAAKELSRTPWSIQVRGEPTPDLVRIAATHGLTKRTLNPFMLRHLADVPMPPFRSLDLKTRRIIGSEHKLFTTTLAAGFEVSPYFFAAVTSPPVLQAPGTTAYLAEIEGAVVATGVGSVAQECVGIFNISTLPQYRRRGYARIMTERILGEGRAAGARTAYLHATEAALRIYETMGFRTVEHWTSFTAA